MEKSVIWTIIIGIILSVFVFSLLIGRFYAPPTGRPSPENDLPLIFRTPTPTISQNPESLVELGVSCYRGKYDWLYCNGIVANNDNQQHSVSGYIDFYDANKIKYDHILFFVNVDPHGKTSFDSVSTDSEKYSGGTYKYYIDRIY